MSNLKFQRTYRTDSKPELMYVSFEKDGKEYKWFPKWCEVKKLVDNSWLTEAELNEGKNMEYLTASLLIAVLRDTLSRNHRKQNKPEDGLPEKFAEFCNLFNEYYSGNNTREQNVKKD